uniref:Potassium channel domain-containing protein n=1 Tax=Monopterus albus TaxID=43700 RepID=A0A3Q3JMP6_MONAL
MGLKEMFHLARVPSILMLGLVYMTYVLIGGVVFWKLEGDLGEKDISVLLQNKKNLLMTYPCLNQEGLDAVVLTAASKAGLSFKNNYTKSGFWKYTSSAVFAATVVTTIGYGNLCPTTSAGQIFCVFFALFGIPLNVVVLNRVGKYILKHLSYTFTWEKYSLEHDNMSAPFHILLQKFLFFIVPMIVFQLQEGWTYSQALYYCFITLSTIGFGDFVAGTSYNPDKMYPDWYSVLMASWIFFGLAWLALIINHSIDILEQLNSHLKRRRQKQEEESNSAEGANPDTQVKEEDDIKKPPVTQ